MRIFYVVLLLALMIPLFSQDLDSEIRNYKESDKIYISKARQFLADEIRNGNIEKTKELSRHLLTKFEGSYNLPLSPWEGFTLGLAVDSLELSLEVLNFVVAETDWDKYIYPEKDALFLLLDDLLAQDHTEFLSSLIDSDLSDEQIKAMVIFLYAISEGLSEDINQEAINDKCDIFLEKYPDSIYSDFVRNDIRYVMVLGNWGYGFDFEVGYNTRTEDLGSHFRDGVDFGFSFYGSYKKTVFKMKVNIVSMSSAEDFEQNGEWERRDHFNFTSYGLQLGFDAFESRKFKFEPHIFLGGCQLDFSEDEDKTEEILLPSWTYGAGISIYYKVSKSIKMDYRTPQNGYWYLSLNCDYYIPTFSNKYDDFDGDSLCITLGFGGNGRPTKRDL